jgi:hypothetical protein
VGATFQDRRFDVRVGGAGAACGGQSEFSGHASGVGYRFL